ncbi:hypothetical protein FA13DRAFT_1780787 [Coprinellus micaceus]|uniref:Uncharacterized protein n=1 Tax=Coprinellus micaceus TaxID=71717 RepID=A0A4Y7SCU5_COPMI|nr:hypothetical protein FA13DRAFT_1780787 [Coprinellus micaceus]
MFDPEPRWAGWWQTTGSSPERWDQLDLTKIEGLALICSDHGTYGLLDGMFEGNHRRASEADIPSFRESQVVSLDSLQFDRHFFPTRTSGWVTGQEVPEFLISLKLVPHVIHLVEASPPFGGFLTVRTSPPSKLNPSASGWTLASTTWRSITRVWAASGQQNFAGLAIRIWVVEALAIPQKQGFLMSREHYLCTRPRLNGPYVAESSSHKSPSLQEAIRTRDLGILDVSESLRPGCEASRVGAGGYRPNGSQIRNTGEMRVRAKEMRRGDLAMGIQIHSRATQRHHHCPHGPDTLNPDKMLPLTRGAMVSLPAKVNCTRISNQLQTVHSPASRHSLGVVLKRLGPSVGLQASRIHLRLHTRATPSSAVEAAGSSTAIGKKGSVTIDVGAFV